MTEAEMLDIIQTNFTPELYDWMKREFSDVCSNGDVAINKLLDELYHIYVLKNKTEEEEMETTYISSIYNTYIGSYLEGAEPDPFWADWPCNAFPPNFFYCKKLKTFLKR